MTFVSLNFIISAALLLNLNGGVLTSNDNPKSDVTEDSPLHTDQLIRKYKYPAETHFVTTRDKYILRVHRISKPGGKPILLQHGLLDSSSGYVVMGTTKSLGYYLHDRGYDVWLGNARGNKYCRNHTTLNPDTDKSFWDFSWHEVGVEDIPAVIDYILNATSSSKLYYVGHSQGTTVLFVMLSMRPEYNDKIILAHALAPAVFMAHMRCPFIHLGERAAKVPALTSMVDFLPNGDLFKGPCLSSKSMEELCLNSVFMAIGSNPTQFNRTKAPLLLSQVPAGMAMKQGLHYLQSILSDKFRQYDYGKENKKKYGQNMPPDYELKKVTAPIVLYYSLNDLLVEPVDVMRLRKLLPNVIMHKMEPPLWNHIDYLYAIDAPKYVNEPVYKLMEKFWIEK